MERARKNSGRNRARRSEIGFSITEMLTVLALAGLMITFVGPAFSESYRAYKVRSAALELSDTLRAARQVAVSTRTPTSVTIDTAVGTYTYTNAKGTTRTIFLPDPVRFVAANPTTITFVTNGTVSTGAATLSLQNTVTKNRADRWTLDLNTVGRITTTKSVVTP